MMRRPARVIFLAAIAVLLSALAAVAGGLYVGLPMATIDLSTSLIRAPVALGNAFDALETAIAGLDVPPSEWSEIQQGFDDAQASVETFVASFPPWVPLPLMGGGLEIGLPLIIVDGLRVSGGFVSDDLVRSVAMWGGVDIPRPLIDIEFEIGEDTGSVLGGLHASAWMLSTELVKQFELLLMGVTLGAGLDLMGADVVPSIAVDVPADVEDGVSAALDALHLDGLSLSSFGVHAMIGFEVGPPFLRLYGDVRWTVPVSSSSGWWGLRAGPVAALIGFVIRF